MQKILQAMQSGGPRPPDIRGPPPKARSDQVEEVYEKPPSYRRQTTPPQPMSSKHPHKTSPQVGPDPLGMHKGTTPSPAYQIPEDSVWNQSYLAKALQNMKETDFAKLKFSPGSNKPVEYEKWIVLMDTTTHAQHTEIGLYWKRVVASAEKAYSKYIKDVSYTRIAISPDEQLPRSMIEERIESRLHMILNYVVPETVVRQCDDKPDVSCALILYRTMVHAGPASKEDCAQMLDILTRPKSYEVRKLQEAMIQFRYARTRLKKYGHTEPEPRQLFETLKAAAYSLTVKDHEFAFRFQLYLTQHSSVNGLVSEQTVQELYEMIVDNARGYVDGIPNADVKVVQQRQYDRRKPYEQQAQRREDMVCYNCGSKDHLYRECPNPRRQNYVQPYQDPVQQPQRYSPKGAGRGAPKGQHQPKGEKDGKGKGKRGKDDAKNQSPKGKGGKRQGRPGAKAAQEWNYDNPEYPCEDYGYDEYPPEDQEQEQETGEPNEEEPYDYGYGWDGQEDQEESEPPENNESVVKTVVTVMQKYAEELAREQQESLSLSSLALEDGDVCIKRADVLLDGGAGHHV